MFISWIGLDACIGIHALLVIVRVGSCLDPSAVQRQPNRVVSNVKGCYMALMVMPVVMYKICRQGLWYMANYRHKSCPPYSP